MEKLRVLSHLFVTMFLYFFGSSTVAPAITDVTMSALCPGRDECSFAIYLTGFQQAVIFLLPNLPLSSFSFFPLFPFPICMLLCILLSFKLTSKGFMNVCVYIYCIASFRLKTMHSGLLESTYFFLGIFFFLLYILSLFVLHARARVCVCVYIYIYIFMHALFACLCPLKCSALKFGLGNLYLKSYKPA